MPRGATAPKRLPSEGKRKPVGTWLPRIRLMFCAEDPITFAQRVVDAFELRRKTEILLRYHLYVDCMPTDGVPNLTPEMVERIVKWAKGLKQSSKDSRYRLLLFSFFHLSVFSFLTSLLPLSFFPFCVRSSARTFPPSFDFWFFRSFFAFFLCFFSFYLRVWSHDRDLLRSVY